MRGFRSSGRSGIQLAHHLAAAKGKTLTKHKPLDGEHVMETVIERNNVILTDNPSASNVSAVSWPAVFAGAIAAAAMSLILFVLGIGLGLGALSPWSGEGISGTAFGISTILWITLTSLVASAVGGYITGRLRTRWLAVHVDEVYFRDTAHGFLAWGVATLLTAVIFTSTTIGALTMGVKAAGSVAETAAQTAATGAVAGIAAGDENSAMAAIDPRESAVSYYLDTLFRPAATTAAPVNALQVQPATTNDGAAKAGGAAQQQGTQPQQQAAAEAASTEAGAKNLTPPQQAALAAGGAGPDTTPAPQGARNRGFLAPQAAPTAMPEVTRIFGRAISQDQLSDDDATYIGRLVAQHTGLSENEAAARVNDVFARTQAELQMMETSAREAADEARAATAKTALWFFVALLVGAFVGSYSATVGGRQRDF
jgi:hypothetical protein